MDTNSDGIITGADVLASTSCRRLGESERARTPRTATRRDPNDLIGWNFVNNTNNPMDDRRPRHVHRGRDRRGGQQRDRGRGPGLERADHAGGVPRLLGQRDRHRGRRGDRLRGQPRRQGHQRQLGRDRDGSHHRRGDPVRRPERRDHRRGRRQQRTRTTTPPSSRPASYSAQYPNVISVAAIGSNGALASFSNYGTGTVQLAAPGVNVYSLDVERQPTAPTAARRWPRPW